MDTLGGGVNSTIEKIFSSGVDIDTELTKVNPVKALTSGQFTKADIGKTVYLSNSQCATQEWRIADVNHDGTTGTVDLFPKYVLENTIRRFDGGSQYYKKSELRTWLTSTFYNGFTTEVQNAMKVQSFPSNGETLNDKVKCPSLNEVGLRCDYSIDEGTIYPIFGSSIIPNNASPNNLAIYKYTNGNAIHYWTRSRSALTLATLSGLSAISGTATATATSATAMPWSPALDFNHKNQNECAAGFCQRTRLIPKLKFRALIYL